MPSMGPALDALGERFSKGSLSDVGWYLRCCAHVMLKYSKDHDHKKVASIRRMYPLMFHAGCLFIELLEKFITIANWSTEDELAADDWIKQNTRADATDGVLDSHLVLGGQMKEVKRIMPKLFKEVMKKHQAGGAKRTRRHCKEGGEGKGGAGGEGEDGGGDDEEELPMAGNTGGSSGSGGSGAAGGSGAWGGLGGSAGSAGSEVEDGGGKGEAGGDGKDESAAGGGAAGGAVKGGGGEEEGKE